MYVSWCKLKLKNKNNYTMSYRFYKKLLQFHNYATTTEIYWIWNIHSLKSY